MIAKPDYQAKVLKSLAKALSNESAHLRRYDLIGKVCGVFGGIIVGLAFFAALRNGDSWGVWYLSLGTVGGLLIGLSVYFASSVKQWPVLRKFIDEKALYEAARNEKP